MGLEHSNNSQVLDLEWGLSMDSKTSGTRKENEGFRGSVVLDHSDTSQKMDLEWVSVWTAKCKELHRKMKGFSGVRGAGAQQQLPEN